MNSWEAQLNVSRSIVNGSDELIRYMHDFTDISNETITSTEREHDVISILFIIAKFFADYVMSVCTIIVMLGMGSTLAWSNIKESLRQPIGLAIGAVGQYIILPGLTIAFALALDLDPYVSIGCLIISSSPGGVYSTFCTYWVDGKTSLSLLMTSVSTLIAFGAMPLNLFMYSPVLIGERRNIVIPYRSIMIGLSMALVPVICGMLIRKYSKRLAEYTTKVTSLVAAILSTLIALSYIWVYWKVYSTASVYLYGCGIGLPIVGFLMSFLMARILCQDYATSRTIGIETGCQNLPVAINIIMLSFPDSKLRNRMLVFPSIYGLFMVTGIFMFMGIYQLIKKIT